MLLKKSKFGKRLKSVVKSCSKKAYLHIYFDAEDSFKDELDHYMLVK